MANFDFIPENVQQTTARIEKVCRAFLTTPRGVYDGRNRYAPKSVVCCGGGNYYFSNRDEDKPFREFCPTTEELRLALSEFKKKGYHPYYDNDVCEYGYVQDRSTIRGEHAILHTEWL